MLKRLKINPENIVLLEAVGNYTRIILDTGGIIISSYSMGKVAAQLPATFIRPTRSTVINLNLASPIYYSRRRRVKSVSSLASYPDYPRAHTS